MGVPFIAPAPVPVVPWTGLYAGINFGWAASNNALGRHRDRHRCVRASARWSPRARSPGRCAGSTVDSSAARRSASIGNSARPGSPASRPTSTGSPTATPSRCFPTGVAAFPALNTTFVRGLDTLGTVRARFGWLMTPLFLAYATGGLAYGETRIGTTFNCPSCTPPAAISSTSSGIATGWTVGAGLEWQFAPRMERQGRIPLGRSRQPQRNHQLPLRRVQQHAHEQRPSARRHRAHGADVQVLVSGGFPAAKPSSALKTTHAI